MCLQNWLQNIGCDLSGLQAGELPTPRAWQVFEDDGRRTQVSSLFVDAVPLARLHGWPQQTCQAPMQLSCCSATTVMLQLSAVPAPANTPAQARSSKPSRLLWHYSQTFHAHVRHTHMSERNMVSPWLTSCVPGVGVAIPGLPGAVQSAAAQLRHPAARLSGCAPLPHWHPCRPPAHDAAAAAARGCTCKRRCVWCVCLLRNSLEPTTQNSMH
jgi:hypothetical protein